MELRVIGGPVRASGYVWYQVVPVSFVLDGHPALGWVAAAGKDGEPWIALPGTTIGSGGVARSTVAREKADPTAAKAAAASVTAFGLDLYKRLFADKILDPTRGAVISPTSIALALGLTLAGAKGDTATEMAKVLHASGWDALGPGLNSLARALASRDATWKDYDGKTHTLALEIANAAFAQSGWPIETAYLDRIAAAFGAGLRLVDFIGHSTAARNAINAWVSAVTKKRIPDLLGPPDVTPLTRLALVNAMYLKAEWERVGDWPLFRGELTKPAPFTRLDGSTVDVPTMETFGGQGVPYARGTGWQATELRYAGGAGYGDAPLAMTLVLPDDLAAFERSLTESQLGRITATLTVQRERLSHVTYPVSEGCEPGTYPYEVHLYLSRFGIDSRADLVDASRRGDRPVPPRATGRQRQPQALALVPGRDHHRRVAGTFGHAAQNRAAGTAPSHWRDRPASVAWRAWTDVQAIRGGRLGDHFGVDHDGLGHGRPHGSPDLRPARPVRERDV